MFKYFDVQDKGCVDFNEFCRVLEKTGMYYPPEQLKPLFASYDTDGSGAVDYKEFSTAIYGPEGAAKAMVKKTPPVEPKT